MTVNHLKNSDAQKKYLTVAFGRQPGKGHISYSFTTGSSPTHQITAYNALGEGEWDGCEGAYWKGIWIPPADYNFHSGALATGMTSGDQQVDPSFDKDVPHSRTAAISYKVPTGLGAADTSATPPTDFEGIFRTKKCPDFDADGEQTDFSFSANPARCIVELLNTYARLPNLPSLYTDWAAYWKTRIDFGNWVDFRDFHDQTETVDYTTIPDFEGFGLTAEFYSGTNFGTLGKRFVHPSLNFPSSSVPPIPQVTTGDFSARFEGFIQGKYTETITFHLTADNGRRLYIAPVGSPYGTALIDVWATDGTSTPGTNTATYAMTAGTFYKIKVEWNDEGVVSHLKLEWSSTSQTQQVIPSKYLYPVAEEKPLYESHVYFEVPTNPAQAIRTILEQTNSLKQDVNGKLRFYCYEQLTSSFTLDNTNIDRFQKAQRRDILQADPITAYEADFKDLDTLFFERPSSPIQIELDYLTRKNAENVKVVNLFNTTRWQALKVLPLRAKLEVGNDFNWEAEAKMSKTYPIMAGDLITATHRKIGESPRLYLVRSAIDKGLAESSRIQTNEPEKRVFTLQEWS